MTKLKTTRMLHLPKLINSSVIPAVSTSGLHKILNKTNKVHESPKLKTQKAKTLEIDP